MRPTVAPNIRAALGRQKRLPMPGKRQRPGRAAWFIFWRDGGRTREISAGQVSETDAETRRQEVALALRGHPWPAWARRPEARAQAEGVGDIEEVLTRYRSNLDAETSPGWARVAAHHVRRWLEYAREHGQGPMQAQEFLDGVAKSLSPATRNRALASCRRFHRWLGGAMPFAGIKTLREMDAAHDIDYLTREERSTVLALAEGEPAGISLWIAFYAGLRREEVMRLAWADVDLRRGVLTVRRSKTGRRRGVPIAQALAKRLRKTPKAKQIGRIVPWPDVGWEHVSRMMLERIGALAAGKGIKAGRVRWNVFRHTFASILIQSGSGKIGIDKLAAWMGNSPAVCLRHYARIIPRDRRDDAIDAL